MNDNATPIVSGEVIEIHEDKGLKVRLDDGRIGTVDLDQITDTNIGSIKSYFKQFPKYKFKVLKEKNTNNELKLSYKMCHPKLVKDKKKIIPTCNHFSTLKRMIWFEIYLYDKSNNLNDVTTKRFNINVNDLQDDNND